MKEERYNKIETNSYLESENNIIVDGDIDIGGHLCVRGFVLVKGNIRVRGFIRTNKYILADGYIKADEYIKAKEYIKAGDFIESDDWIISRQFIEAEDYIKAGDWISANEWIRATNLIKAGKYICTPKQDIQANTIEADFIHFHKNIGRVRKYWSKKEILKDYKHIILEHKSCNEEIREKAIELSENSKYVIKIEKILKDKDFTSLEKLALELFFKDYIAAGFKSSSIEKPLIDEVSLKKQQY